MSNNNVEILEHTADLRIRIRAKTRVGLFVHALIGMFAVTAPEYTDSAEVRREITVESVDQNALLVDFLGEALRLADTYDEAYVRAEILELSSTRLRSAVVGRPVRRAALDIKAVTHYGVNIREENGEWIVEIVFDI